MTRRQVCVYALGVMSGAMIAAGLSLIANPADHALPACQTVYLTGGAR